MADQCEISPIISASENRQNFHRHLKCENSIKTLMHLNLFYFVLGQEMYKYMVHG